MEAIFTQLINNSPILGLMFLFWFYQRADYQKFTQKVLEENSKREENYQQTITELSHHLGIVENVQNDVEDIKDRLNYMERK